MLSKANTPKAKPMKKPAAAASAVSTAFSKGSADEKAAKEADANAERREILKAKVENNMIVLFCSYHSMRGMRRSGGYRA